MHSGSVTLTAQLHKNDYLHLKLTKIIVVKHHSPKTGFHKAGQLNLEATAALYIKNAYAISEFHSLLMSVFIVEDTQGRGLCFPICKDISVKILTITFFFPDSKVGMPVNC